LTIARALGDVDRRNLVSRDHDAGSDRTEHHGGVGLSQVVLLRLTGKCERVRAGRQGSELVIVRRRRNEHHRGQRLVTIGGRSRGILVLRCRHVAAVQIDAGRASARKSARDLTLDRAESDVHRRGLPGGDDRRRDRREYHHRRVGLTAGAAVCRGGATDIRAFALTGCRFDNRWQSTATRIELPVSLFAQRGVHFVDRWTYQEYFVKQHFGKRSRSHFLS
jgi:hypothetical protein